MSLFLVNRYLGDEEDPSVFKESRSRELLAKLQQKAKEKRKDSLGEQKQCLAEEQRVRKRGQAEQDSCEEPQQHRKRKAKEEEVLCVLDSCPQPPGKTKAKKKKAKEKLHSGSPNEDTSLNGGDEAKITDMENINRSSGKTSAPTGFTVLGGFESKPVQKVHRVLPQWLTEPDLIHRDIRNNLVPTADVSGICAQLRRSLHSHGIKNLFPVQAEVIPAVLESSQEGFLFGRGGYRPRDICVSAPTGSGKTLAFVIPVIQVLMKRVVCEVRALAVLPTKELAQQVYKVFMSYAEGTPLRVVLLAGQKSFAAEHASLSVLGGGIRRSLADIVVATPGRLVDHINKNSDLHLEHLRFLIIDEADRMIDSMHQSWLTQVVKAVYRSEVAAGHQSVLQRVEPVCITAASLSPPQIPLQKLLFSATLTQNPEKLKLLDLHQPRLFSSTHTAEAPTLQQDGFHFPQGLTEYYVPCTLNNKPLHILHFIIRMKLSPVLCFTNSRETAHRLYLLVQLFGGIQAAEFSSRLSPGQRKKTLKEFEKGKVQLLISTDAAARGIDINAVKCVVNYDAPQFIRTYIHRIGRTARAGKSGLAFTFLLRVQEKKFLQMLSDAGSPGIQKQMVKPESMKSLEERYEQTLHELADVIKNEKAKI
ncbi:ATP-dependent RNA helicase DDX51 [Gouania willdenowi]|uniref:ATP-dependent RNA helicase n=1 Tax=Gouania willdenowi TaxID=441366 RepID=A0A8C5EM22_GOUWI|nr:ATP-dependent RNA helicase DDX51 [Gouania willdenowi]